MSESPAASRNPILSKARLPCGRDIQNRLVKAALYEHASNFLGGPPNEAHFSIYKRWAHANWGMIITGNVQVSKCHGGLGRDVIIPDTFSEEVLQPYRQWASVIHGETGHIPIQKAQRPLAIMQLCHTGRQSPNIIGGRPPFTPPLAPSAVPVNLNQKQPSVVASVLGSLMFPTPRAMTLKDIDEAVGEFVRGAQVAAKSGFDGVQVHASHGYLVAQFMSPKTNHRKDEYSAESLLFLKRILSSIRAPGVVPQDFVLGIKLNAADYVERSAVTQTASGDRVMDHFKQIVSWGMLDFIEISGGDYENPDFMLELPKSPRQALFADFSSRAMKELSQISIPNTPRPLILLTGGLKTPELLTSALTQNQADLLGIGRLSIACPELPLILARYLTSASEDPKIPDDAIPDVDHPYSQLPLLVQSERNLTIFLEHLWDRLPHSLKPEFPKLLGAGMNIAKFTVMLRAVGSGQEKVTYPGQGLGAVLRMWLWVAPGNSTGVRGWWFLGIILLLSLSWGLPI